MRISTNMTYHDFLTNLGTNATNVQKTLNQLSTLKEVSKSSDNPLLVSKIMNLNVSLGQNDTYAQEIKDGISWSNTQDGALASAKQSLDHIRDLLQNSANATTGPDEVRANKNEIQQEIQAIVESLNTNFDGRYIFAGKNTTTAPFSVIKKDDEVIGIQYNGTKENLPRQIADNVQVDLVTNGDKLLTIDGNKEKNLNSFFNEVIGQLTDYIASSSEEDKQKFGTDFLNDIDEFASNFVNVRTQVGTIANRLKAASDRSDTEKLNLTQALSERQDVDVAEKYMEYQNQMLAYQTTMAMGSKIMQTSILDYVR